MSEKVQKILTRLGNIWPKRIDDETLGEWLADWESALKQFEPWLIDAATTRIVHDRTSDRFPLPADVRRVCFQVLADDRQSKPGPEISKMQRDPYGFANEFIYCELGKRAAQEGWVLSLRDFVVKEGRLPTESEIRKLISIRDKFLQDLIDCIDGRGGIMGGPLSKLGRSMAKREYEIAQRVIGPDVSDWYAGQLNNASRCHAGG